MIAPMRLPVVLLDEETHVYTVDGVPKRALHAILQPFQPEIPEAAFAMVENARFRGKQIHEACAMILTGLQWNPEDLAEEAKPYVDAFADFMAVVNPKPIQVEQPLYCEHLDFCCTPDFVTPYAVYDIKTTAKPSRTWGLQTAAQALSCQHTDRYMERHIVWLRPKRRHTWELHSALEGHPRIFNGWDFEVIRDAAKGDYESKAISLWRMG